MAGNQRIESIINSSKVKDELKELVEGLEKAHSLIINTPQITSVYKKSEGLAEFKKASEELIASNKKILEMQKQMEDQAKKLSILEKKLAEERENHSRTNKKKTDEELRASIKQREETNLRIASIKAETDAYKALELEHKKASAEAKRLGAESLKDHGNKDKAAAAEKALAKAKELFDQLKAIDAKAGQFFKNVGNYQGSAEIIVRALDKMRAKAADAVRDFGQMSPEAQAAGRAVQGLQRIVDQPQFLNISAKVGDSTAEIKFFTKALDDLNRRGLGNSEFAVELKQRLAQLTDEIGDTRAEIKAMSSDTRSFDLFAGGVNTAVSSMQTFVGLQALTGKGNEDVQKSLETLMAVENVANGVRSIATELTTKGTLANKAYAVVQGLVKTALDSTAAASVRAAAATKLLLGGLILGGLVFLIMKLKEWSDATKRISADQKILNEVRQKSIEGYAKEVSQLEVLRIKLADLKIPQNERVKLAKEYNKTADEGNKIDVTQINNINLLNSAIDKQIGKIKERALAQAAANVTESKATSLFEAQQRLTEIAPDFLLSLDKIDQQIENARKDYEDLAYKRAFDIRVNGKLIDQNVVITKSKILSALKEIRTANEEFTRAANLTAKLPTGEQKCPPGYHWDPVKNQCVKDGGKPGSDKEQNDQIEKDLKARFEIYRLSKERELELFERTIDDDKATYAERVLAAINFVETKQRLITDNAAFDKSFGKKTENEKLLIEKQASLDRIRVAEDVEKKLKDISDEAKKRLAEKKAPSATEVFSEAPLENQSAWYKKLKKEVTEYGEKQDKLAAKEKQYHEERKERLKELVAEVKETAYALFVAPIERQKNALAEAQELKDKNYQREIENIQNSTLSEEDKANRIKVLEVQNLAQKEQTARKIRDLDEKKARFDRAKSITDIIQNTAAAIIKTIADFPGPQGIALSIIIGLIGAAQLTRAIATPIPKYYRGRRKSDPYEGPALAGEVQPEVLRRKDGSVELIDKPTVIDVKKGDEVFPDINKYVSSIIPHDEVNNIVLQSMMQNTIRMISIPESKMSKKIDELKELVTWQTLQLKEAYKNSKQPIHINITDFKNSDYIKRTVKE